MKAHRLFAIMAVVESRFNARSVYVPGLGPGGRGDGGFVQRGGAVVRGEHHSGAVEAGELRRTVLTVHHLIQAGRQAGRRRMWVKADGEGKGEQSQMQ